jgi:nucleotide-binding universal stress UspA family protein
VERGAAPWRRVLVPHRDPEHDAAALEAGLRIASARDLELTELRVVDEGAELPTPDDVLPPAWREHPLARRVTVRVVGSRSPVDVVVDEVRRGGHDLVVIGVARAWGLTPAFFGVRHERIVEETTASLLIVREHRPGHAPHVAAAPRPSGEAATA